MLRIPVHSAILYLTSASCLVAAFHPRSDGAEQVLPAEIPTATAVDLAELFEEPSAHLGQSVRFVAQFHSVEEQWNPYLTRFGTEHFAFVRFWGDDQELWLPEDYERPIGGAFARRTAPWLDGLRDSRPYQRYEIVATVRQVFLDRPWMEIESVHPLAGSLTEGALVHASRGVALFRNEQWKLARNEFERASIASIDDRARVELARLIDVCRAASGER